MPIETRALTLAELDQVSGAALNVYLKLKGNKEGSPGEPAGTIAAAAIAGARCSTRDK